MTKAIKKALKAVAIPGVRFNPKYGQFYCRIGYSKSKSGKRQRAFHYLGTDEREAIAKATVIKSKWKSIKRRTPQGAPVWPTDRQAMNDSEYRAESDRIEKENTEVAIEQGEGQTIQLTLNRVRELYLEYRKTKIGIGGGEGIKQSTYSEDARNLGLALAHVNAQQLINGLGYAEIESLKDAIFRRCDSTGSNAISRRTAVNYCRSVKGFLDWAHRNQLVPYRHPEDIADLFSFRKFTPIAIAEYDKETMKALLGCASARERLYVLLGLNCGYYQSDIGSLLHADIVEREGRTAIERKRGKTSHQNDFQSCHVLWDETARLLKSELAPKNQPFALLNENGKALYRRDQNGKYDGVSDAYNKLQERSKISLPYKQFRKLGATALERIGGQQARRLYKAGTIDSGDAVYVREAWSNLTPHLDRWGAELRSDGVLTD